MSFFKKAMSSVGIGAAKVDTVLHNSNVQAGQQVTGVVNIKGGSVDQRIDDIYLEVMTTYEKEVDDQKVNQSAVIQKVNIPINNTIQKGQQAQIPFQFILSPKTPVTAGGIKVWIHTGLDIKMAIDPTDKDHLNVSPHPYLELMLLSLQQAGFELRKVKNEASRFDRELPFIQNFELVPRSGPFRGRLDEVEMALSIEYGQLKALFEIDRRGGFFSEAMGMDESKAVFTLTELEMQQGPQYVANKVTQFINQYA